jgi:hypothetical protein
VLSEVHYTADKFKIVDVNIQFPVKRLRKIGWGKFWSFVLLSLYGATRSFKADFDLNALFFIFLHYVIITLGASRGSTRENRKHGAVQGQELFIKIQDEIVVFSASGKSAISETPSDNHVKSGWITSARNRTPQRESTPRGGHCVFYENGKLSSLAVKRAPSSLPSMADANARETSFESQAPSAVFVQHPPFQWHTFSFVVSLLFFGRFSLSLLLLFLLFRFIMYTLVLWHYHASMQLPASPAHVPVRGMAGYLQSGVRRRRT